MIARSLKSDFLLLITAMIWGVAFVAQRVGMDFIGPFTFNGFRFALGVLVLVPFAFCRTNRNVISSEIFPPPSLRTKFIGALAAGVILFGGASLQQIGLVYTTAGKAGFITGLYVVMVPILGMAVGQKTHRGTWFGALLSAVGLYLLSVTENFTIAFGDLLVLLGAGLWAVHVHLISWLSPKMNAIRLAIVQNVTCALLSLLVALIFEHISGAQLQQAAAAIFYGGALSVGVAYTLQVVAQKQAHPAHAAILLSLEAVFAALGGWLWLNEILPLRGLLGCSLMMGGMLISQLYGFIDRTA